MTNRSKILALSVVAIALSACSGMQEKSTYAAESRVIAPDGQVVDASYVANVDYLAKQRGVEVRWVNMPTKRVATSE
ncbi:MAG TPA: hypothetical protein VFI26_08830 [Lysobacter sp.]|nr:hypothetical protein [Lysobacter sp.]